MKKLLLVPFLMLALLTACSSMGMSGQSVTSQNGIEISNPVMMSAGSGETTGAFMQIKNTGAETDRLVGATCELAGMAQVHETIMDGDTMKMQQVEAVEIPAGQILELKHGSYHVMLMDLKQEVKAGEKVTLTLQFEKAGPVTVSALVMKR
jgi:copper(I)-binding protein